MKILFIRGAFLNRFEGQNYEPLVKNHQIVGVGSLTSIHKKFDFPVKLFFSPYDLVRRIGRIGQIGLIGEISGCLARGVFNRVLGDSHFLFGLENFIDRGVFQSINRLKHWDIGHIAETYYGYDLQTVRLKQKGYIKKIISTCWETIPFNNETVEKKKRIKEIVKKNTDLFICPTEKAKKALMVEGIGEGRIKVISVGIDLNRFKSQMSNLKCQIHNLKLKTFNMLFVGRLVEEKGIMDLYEVFKNVKCQMSSFDKLRMTLSEARYRLAPGEAEVSNVKTGLKLRIVGEGILRKKLIKNIKKDGFGNDVLLENKPYEEMPKVYQEADLLVVPSRSTKTWEEQYGMALVEAMASGLPIVAYRSGAIPEVLGNGGMLVNEGEVNGLTKAILTLIDNKDLRIKLGKMGRRRAEKEFDAKKTVKKLEKIYERVNSC